MKEDLKELYWVCVLLTGFLFLIFLYDWCLRAHITEGPESGLGFHAFKYFMALRKSLMYLRLAWVAFMAGIFWMSPNRKASLDATPNQRTFWAVSALALSGLFIWGFLPWAVYNLFVFPLLFAILPVFISKAVNLNSIPMKDTTPLKGVSSIGQSEKSFEFKTDKGLLVVNNPMQGIYIEGGAGSGKSNSLCEPLIAQAVAKDFALLIYDFKGNPATLGQTAYSAIVHYKKDMPWTFINFMDPTRSSKCNPISTRYISNSLELKDAVITLMYNLNKEWITKADFWAQSACLYVEGIMRRLYNLAKNDPAMEKYLTIPHVVSISLMSLSTTLPWLRRDRDVTATISSILTAFDNNAEAQIAGVGASAQTPLTKLNTEEIFWVLSEDATDLDINRAGSPSLLSVANDPKLRESLSPAISLILKTCLKLANSQGKHPRTLVMIDELPTVYIPKLDETPATGRSNGIVTALSVQDYAQLDRDYSSKQAETIIGNLGNQFFGMSNNLKTGERVSNMLGEEKRRDSSISVSDSGGSESYSMKREKVIQPKDVLGQKIGHFTGKVAGGEPPFFSVQFPRFEDMGIPKSKVPPFSRLFHTDDPKLEQRLMDAALKANKARIDEEADWLVSSDL